ASNGWAAFYNGARARLVVTRTALRPQGGHMTGSIAILALSLATLQVQAPLPQPAATDALVQEVRALREAVEQVLSASIRVQLMMGRLQLQEARIQALVRQEAELEARIAGVE